jgi:5'-phosphate synthase pdxT subunit
LPREVGKNLSKVGVLAVQGSVREHIACLSRIEGVTPLAVKTKEDILSLDALILPGGESTAIGKIIKEFSLVDAICELNQRRKPIWGTCAGMILLAKEIADEDVFHLGFMNIKVRRNAFGGQLDSFTIRTYIPEVSKELQTLVFIRAPIIEETGREVKVLAEINGKAVAARQDNLLVTSFHPELTDELSFYKYFISLIADSKLDNSSIDIFLTCK